MQVTTSTTIVVNLQLTREEALMLQTLVQNPIMPDEPQELSNLRANLFNGIKSSLEQQGSAMYYPPGVRGH